MQQGISSNVCLCVFRCWSTHHVEIIIVNVVIAIISSLSQWTLKKNSLNFIFPTKYVIPKSLKFSHWPSKYQSTKRSVSEKSISTMKASQSHVFFSAVWSRFKNNYTNLRHFREVPRRQIKICSPTQRVSNFVLPSLTIMCAMVGHPTFNRNPYSGYINPYYWVDDHPLLYIYGNNGSLGLGTCVCFCPDIGGDLNKNLVSLLPQGIIITSRFNA